MRVFVTGATGLLGSAVVQGLLGAGHRVLGLARSEAAADTLARLGIEVHHGNLLDPDSLAAGARACDGVIHTAFIHDFAQYEVNVEVDRQALMAMAEALRGSGKPLVGTSLTAVLAHGRLGTELDNPVPNGLGTVRAACKAVLEAANWGVRVSLVRMPPSVHGPGDKGLVPMMIDLARNAGVAAYVGEGTNCWPAVHRLDAARLYRLALEKGAPGSRFHAVAEQGIPMRTIAETIGRGLNMPVYSLSESGAADYFGWIAPFVTTDNPTSSAITREALGWHPQQPGLVSDLQSNYFR